MPLANAIDWSAKYSALYQWVSWAIGWTTRWADQDAPRPDYPYVILDLLTDAKEGGLDEVTRTIDLTRARDIRITPVVADSQLYRVTINGSDHDYTSDSDATLAEICAGIAAAISGGSEPVAPTDNGTSVDVLGDDEAANPGTPQLFTVVLSGPMSWENNDTGNEVAVRASGSTAFTLNVQAFERNTREDNPASDPGRNAYNVLTTLRASLGLPSVQAALRAADIAVIEEEAINDLSEPVDETILSRASLDVRMRTVYELTEYQGYIDQVSGASTYEGAKDSPINDTLQVSS